MEHFRITVAGKAYDVVVEKIDGDEADNSYTPAPVTRAAPPAVRPAAASPALVPAPVKVAAAAGDVTSPLAGIVQAIELSAGSAVHEGDLVLTLEAMKMYTSINASATGTIKVIHVKVGDAVEEGQVLYSIG
jgi:biotin carboxyl carrier protein